MEDQLSPPRLRMTVSDHTLPLFTTVLQSGIEVKTGHGETLANFLNNFPGFTAEYLADTVQTIFLNGTAVDDLSLPLTGQNPVLALSAAMPGLAGAIFRKNSFHSALRTETKKVHDSDASESSVTVTLKLFNSIAKDRGEALLKAGLCMRADHLAVFLNKRPHLTRHIKSIQFGENEMDLVELLRVLPGLSKVTLNIVSTDG